MSATEATQSPSTKVVPSENILNDKVWFILFFFFLFFFMKKDI